MYVPLQKLLVGNFVSWSLFSPSQYCGIRIIHCGLIFLEIFDTICPLTSGHIGILTWTSLLNNDLLITVGTEHRKYCFQQKLTIAVMFDSTVCLLHASVFPSRHAIFRGAPCSKIFCRCGNFTKEICKPGKTWFTSATGKDTRNYKHHSNVTCD